MRVKRNFEALYRSKKDPWDIGQANSIDTIATSVSSRRTRGIRALDIGCGTEAFRALQ